MEGGSLDFKSELNMCDVTNCGGIGGQTLCHLQSLVLRRQIEWLDYYTLMELKCLQRAER
jgi:hypothetical protein